MNYGDCIHPDILYHQCQTNWLVRSCLMRQAARIRGYNCQSESHNLLLKQGWLDLAVISVYTGLVVLEDGKTHVPVANKSLLLQQKRGYQVFRFGNYPKSYNYRHINYGFGLGQALHKEICRYEKLRALNFDAIEAYGAGMLQYATPKQVSAAEQEEYNALFQKQGTATVAFTDLETKISSHKISYDWQSTQNELEEARLAIEFSLWGSDSRKSAQLVSEVEQSDTLTGFTAKLFDEHVINCCEVLFGVTLEFKEAVDSIKDLQNLSTAGNITNKAIESAVGSENLEAF